MTQFRDSLASGAALTLCLALIGGSASAPLSAQTTQEHVPAMRWVMHELAPGVFASIAAPPAETAQYSSSLIVIQDDHVVVVDTRESPAAAHALLRDIRELTDKPVSIVINTHWHGDHVYGNQVFAEAFPDVRILAHPHTRTKLESDGEAQRVASVERHRKNAARWRRWIESGQTDSGHRLSAEERAEVERGITRADFDAEALETVRITLPTDTVATLRVLRGRREIQVIHPGPAHTNGDLVVYLPEEHLLAAGDLVEQGFPYFGDGTVVGSAWALDRLALLDVERVLPSHARVQARPDLLTSQRAFLRTVVDAARRDATPRVERFRDTFTQGNDALDERFDSFVADLSRLAAEESDTVRTVVAACGAPEHRRFDFWIGTWEVTGPQGAVVGHSRVESTHGGCVLLENWTGATGSVGQSFNSYDRGRGVWHQSWVDNSGTVLLLDGQATDSGMQLSGETTAGDGSVTQQRITWTIEADDGSRVRQRWEASTDGGESWSVAFDGLYQRTGS
jgi:glyoxylase-like metal-dependent hydrolase (beta-lactamase superfamily II)